MSRIPLLLIGGLIAAAAVYQVLERVPTDALNVALGVACGIGASIPVSLGLLMALTRQRQQNRAQGDWDDRELERARFVPQNNSQPTASRQQTPQIIVIAPPQSQFAPGQMPQGFPLPAQWLNQQYPSIQENPDAVDARDWRIIGEE